MSQKIRVWNNTQKFGSPHIILLPGGIVLPPNSSCLIDEDLALPLIKAGLLSRSAPPQLTSIPKNNHKPDISMDMTRFQLLELCSRYNISVNKRMRKEELFNLLKQYFEKH